MRVGVGLLLVAAGGAWGSLAIASAPGTGLRLKYAKELSIPAHDKEELVATPLDNEVFAATRDGLPDLRVLEGDGKEVAFIVRPITSATADTTRRTWTAKIPKVKLLDGDGLEVVVELAKDDPVPDGLRIVSPLVNFQQRVRVFTSPDGETWSDAADEDVLFDYTQFMDVRNDSLKLAKLKGAEGKSAPPRFFKLVIDDVTHEQQSQLMELTRRLKGGEETDRSERVAIVRQPFRIDRIEFWKDVVQTGNKLVDYPIKRGASEELVKEKQTVIPLTTDRQPLTSLRLVTDDRNFSRSARVEVERKHGVESSWETLDTATVSRIHFQDLHRENLDLVFPESREGALRIVIENRDSQPLMVTAVEGRGSGYEVVFLAAPGGKYQLAYGGETIEAPNYDTAALRDLLAANYRPIDARAEAQTALADAAPELVEPLISRLLRSRLFLSLVVAAFTAILGVGLYKATQRVNDLPK